MKSMEDCEMKDLNVGMNRKTPSTLKMKWRMRMNTRLRPTTNMLGHK
jgi:hypothetical protein